MPQNRFDVIILGDSLASRIAGTLLARGGCRVLAFTGTEADAPSWFFSSLHLEHLLEWLDGRSCLTAPAPAQLLTADCRLEFGCPDAFADELRREFPADHGEAIRLLTQLEGLGRSTEEALWHGGGLPLLGLFSRWRFAGRALRCGLTRRTLFRPLRERLACLRHEPTRRALTALFAGLALAPADSISAAEAGILWSGAVRGEGVCASSIDTLLQHRFRQFHGQTEDISHLHTVQCEGNRLSGATLFGGGRCSGRAFLLGSAAGSAFLPPPPPALPSPLAISRFVTSTLTGMVPPPLANRAILGGERPLRLTLSDSGEETVCRVEGYAHPNDEETVRVALAGLFPFADAQATRRSPRQTATAVHRTGARRASFPGALGSLRLGQNLFACCGGSLLPSLGPTGDVLIGVTVANHLLRTLRKDL